MIHEAVENKEKTKAAGEIVDKYPEERVHNTAKFPTSKESQKMIHKTLEKKEKTETA